MDEQILLSFDQLPPPLNGKGGLLRLNHHQRTVIQNGWNGRVLEEVLRQNWDQWKPITCCRVNFVLRLARLMDLTNLYARFKVVEDALIRGGLLIDDGPDVVIGLEATQIKVPRTKQGIDIVIRICQRDPRPEGWERRGDGTWWKIVQPNLKRRRG